MIPNNKYGFCILYKIKWLIFSSSNFYISPKMKKPESANCSYPVKIGCYLVINGCYLVINYCYLVSFKNQNRILNLKAINPTVLKTNHCIFTPQYSSFFVRYSIFF
ncbi:MAG: hypothetical protein B6I20_08650 [Bacteroidetes bacterium 4572_117]|nr:MAG: hypothetical protein B6I20_08650 [Bacteroidetes bacterium 4572_117]